MEVLLEVILEFVGEGLLQLFVHVLGDMGANMVAAYRQRGPRNRFVSAIGHTFFGAVFGGLSLLLFRHSFAHTETARLVALIGSPLLAGLCSALLGTWKRRRSGHALVLFETFSYGVLFAFAFALVRYLATAPPT
jgi:hypothetical protein